MTIEKEAALTRAIAGACNLPGFRQDGGSVCYLEDATTLRFQGDTPGEQFRVTVVQIPEADLEAEREIRRVENRECWEKAVKTLTQTGALFLSGSVLRDFTVDEPTPEALDLEVIAMLSTCKVRHQGRDIGGGRGYPCLGSLLWDLENYGAVFPVPADLDDETILAKVAAGKLKRE